MYGKQGKRARASASQKLACYSPLPLFSSPVSLEEVIHNGKELYLVFEFMNMDLKKYFDSIPRDSSMDPMLVKVCMPVRMCVCLSVCVLTLSLSHYSELLVSADGGDALLPQETCPPP